MTTLTKVVSRLGKVQQTLIVETWKQPAVHIYNSSQTKGSASERPAWPTFRSVHAQPPKHIVKLGYATGLKLGLMLCVFLLQKAVYCPLVSPGDVTDALSSWLGKALVKSIADTAQCIRTSAISMFRVLIEQHPDAILPMLPYAMPVLEGRLHVDENSNRQEQSEEIRLLLLQVWHGSKLITAITNSAP